MDRKLRRKITGRLLAVTVALAAVAGGAAYFLERRAIDDRILLLALGETAGLAAHVEGLATSGPAELDQARAELTAHVLAEHITEGHFVVIEIYDLAHRKLVEAMHPAYVEVEREVDAKHHVERPGERLVHTWLSIGGVSYVQVFAPLRAGHRTLAYFEGTFRVDPDAMRRMDRELAWSVLLVVLVVFATAAVLSPILLRLNGDLLRANDDLLRLSGDLAHANMGMLAALGSAVARRDRGTGAHNYRVTIYAIHLAEALRLPDDTIRGIIKGAFLHDIGKLGVADAILRKPTQLTPEERDLMKVHVRYGVQILGKFEWLQDALDVVRCHHERVDGSGYPAGLRGAQIPVAARVFMVVDVFDALTSRRSYKAPTSLEETMRVLEEGRGRSFDPEVLEAFAGLAPELHRTVSGADERQLAKALDRLLARYFPAPGGGAGGRGPPGLTPESAAGETDLDYLSGSWVLERAPQDPEQGQEPSPDPFQA
jgi:putative nucleotidyltransferase with HDIG domain